MAGPHIISQALQDRLGEAVSVLAVDPSVAVERGYDGGSTRLALLLLACAGGILVLGGVLSSSLLALADARPDFGTLMAVGASPRIRRSMAASYAAVTVCSALSLAPSRVWDRGSPEPVLTASVPDLQPS